MPSTFADLALRPELLDALTGLGYEEPTPIQRESIPPLMEGKDLLGQAATGTGKTAAFALPVLHRLAEGGGDGVPERAPGALVLVPTRELAMQVSEAAHKYGRGLGTRVVPVYGGQPVHRQTRLLERGVDVVVATPGRAVDLLNRGALDLTHLRAIVLDEADEMLDMGFAEDLDAVFAAAPDERQTVLFSATMPPRIDQIAHRHLKDPVRLQIAREVQAEGEAPKVRQVAHVVQRAHKAAALGRVLDVEQPEAAIVFCRTRDEVDQLTESLNGRGYRAEPLHGGMSQEQRDRVMGRLRAGTSDLLIATDVAARGLDIEQLTHVFNFDVPSAPESYVHRIGRVGRAGREGAAITLAEPREHRQIQNIQRVTGQKISIERLPTVADLRAKRMEVLRGQLHERLLGDDFDRFRVVVESLGDEFDVMQIAMAAIQLASDASATEADETDIPVAEVRSGGGGRERGRGDRPERGGRGGRPQRGASPGMTRVFVGAGREAGMRPQDLVGAITGETSLSGRQIGAIEITDRFALVEVPESEADHVIEVLRGTRIKGRRQTVRRERY